MERWWVPDVAILVMCAVGISLAFALQPGPDLVSVFGWDIPELCGFKRLTGYPCPGCGLTRSWVYLAHGNWSTAWSMNFLGPVLFLTAALQIPLRGFRLWREALRRRRVARARALAREEECPSCPA